MNVTAYITLIGGLALFLYGVGRMSDGLQQLAGAKLRPLLARFIRNRFSGIGAGIGITFLLQSSSASTVLYVSIVEGGLVRFADTIPLILGAMIGTTLTVQVIAFSISDYALLAVALGVAMRIASHKVIVRQWADLILGIGLIFFGMSVMKTGVAPLRQSPQFTEWFQHAIGMPWVAFILAAVFTAIVQASAATIALVFACATAGLLGTDNEQIIRLSLPFIFGANVGTTITALLASIHTGRDAVRVAVAHTGMKLLSAVLFMWLITPLAELTVWLSSHIQPGEISSQRYIANSHTLFNLLTVIVYLPFTHTLALICEKILPEKQRTKLFPELAAQPEETDETILFQRIRNAISRLCEMVEKDVQLMVEAVEQPSLSTVEKVKLHDDIVDAGYHEIRNYALLFHRTTHSRAFESTGIWCIQCAELLERIGDDMSRSIGHVIEKMAKAGITFGIEDTAAIRHVEKRLIELLEQTKKLILHPDSAEADVLRTRTAEIKQEIRAMREAHYNAVTYDVPHAAESSEYFSDILAECEASVSKVKRLGRIVKST